MKKIKFKYITAMFVLIVLLVACQKQPNLSIANNASNPVTFDLDTLYSIPSMIGTKPKNPVWSADSQQVAFLWNEKGYPYRDVWSYSLKTGKKTQLTRHDISIDGKLEQELNTGISEVVWLDSTSSLIAYVLKGKLYIKAPGKAARVLANDKYTVSQLALSPNGLYLSFVNDGHLWVRSSDIDNNNPAIKWVDSEHNKAVISSYQWAANSDGLVFNITDTRLLPERDIYYYANADIQKHRVSRAFPGEQTARINIGFVNIANGKRQMFSRPDAQHPVWSYGLSQDGKSLFINSSDFLVKTHTVYRYDVDTGKREVFYQEYDEKHLRPDWKVAWAPQDNGLIILTDRDGYLHLYHQSMVNSAPRIITRGQWEIANFLVDHNNSQIYFLANKSSVSERQLYRVPVNGGQIERISAEVAGTHQVLLSPNMKHALTLFSNDVTPFDLYMINLGNKQTTQITFSPQPTFFQHTWATTRYLEFDSDIDNAQLIGRLSLPPNYDASKRYPLIVGSVYSDSVRNQYGGRISHPLWGFDQFLVAQGYLVLNVNVRGSWGQGRLHNQGLRYRYGVIDIEDLHSGVKHLVKEGYVDAQRVGIWGSSYGGLMTMMSLFKKPGVYAAGIAGAPATNVSHAYPAQMWVMGETIGDDQPLRYQQQSALYHTQGLDDPLMIIHGSKDHVVLYSDTISVVEKLIAQEKMFELVTIPGAAHGWDNEGSAQKRFAFKKMVEFFNRHLMPDRK